MDQTKSANNDGLPPGEKFSVVYDDRSPRMRFPGLGGEPVETTTVYSVMVRIPRRIWRNDVVAVSYHPASGDPDWDAIVIAKAKADHAARRRAFHLLRQDSSRFFDDAPELPDGQRFAACVREGKPVAHRELPELEVWIKGSPEHLARVIDVPAEDDLASRVSEVLATLAKEAWTHYRRRALASEAGH